MTAARKKLTANRRRVIHTDLAVAQALEEVRFLIFESERRVRQVLLHGENERLSHEINERVLAAAAVLHQLHPQSIFA